jgi:signal peptidase I
MKLLKGLFGLLVFLAVLLVIGRIFFFQIAQTKSYSMVPNLMSGDTFLVFTLGRLGPGESAMCKDPENPGMMIVSRILGVPGSTFEIRNNDLYLNDRRIDRQFSNPDLLYQDNTGDEQAEFIVSVPTEKVAGHVYNIALTDRAGDRNFDKIDVETGFFLAGDNRNRSRDSREFGEIPINDCVGTPFMIVWPGPDSGDFKFKNRFLNWID